MIRQCVDWALAPTAVRNQFGSLRFVSFDVATHLAFRTTTVSDIHVWNAQCAHVLVARVRWGFAVRITHHNCLRRLHFGALRRHIIFYCHFNFIKIIHNHLRVRYSSVHLFWILELGITPRATRSRRRETTKKKKKKWKSQKLTVLGRFMKMRTVNISTPDERNRLITQNFAQYDETLSNGDTAQRRTMASRFDKNSFRDVSSDIVVRDHFWAVSIFVRNSRSCSHDLRNTHAAPLARGTSHRVDDQLKQITNHFFPYIYKTLLSLAAHNYVVQRSMFLSFSYFFFFFRFCVFSAAVT